MRKGLFGRRHWKPIYDPKKLAEIERRKKLKAAMEKLRGEVMPEGHKDSKITAQYEEGRGTRRCGMCRYYRIGRCTMVEGSISPNMVCKHFKVREDI